MVEKKRPIMHSGEYPSCLRKKACWAKVNWSVVILISSQVAAFSNSPLFPCVTYFEIPVDMFSLLDLRVANRLSQSATSHRARGHADHTQTAHSTQTQWCRSVLPWPFVLEAQCCFPFNTSPFAGPHASSENRSRGSGAPVLGVVTECLKQRRPGCGRRETRAIYIESGQYWPWSPSPRLIDGSLRPHIGKHG